MDASVSNRENVMIDVDKVYDENKGGIQLYLPRTNKTRVPLQGR